MRMERVEETLERIGQEALRTPGGVLAFDGDGTLWSGDVGDDLFLALLDNGDIRPEAHAALVRLGAAHGLEAGLGARELAHQLFAEFEAGRIPEKEVYEMVAWLFAGWRVEAVRDFARDVVARREVKRRIHPEARRVVEWARGRGIPCYVVSASPLAVVQAAVVEVEGLSPSNVLACTPREDGGFVLPAIVEPIPYAAGKVQCLRARTSQPLYAAFGDNVFDFEMLAASRVPVAIRPKPRLRARAPELPALVQLQPEE
ncbi:haloacid dehalogenase-like hydrolase [Pyxidicoccus fallax]|uniref:Haloacid dehalogenase-like hydrolase n=1 Tax=Pyxidicoccus fallax TaxID=394095 RepID=A0A848LMI1_9BACT|nr:haloacid dehalogenase-like hydrolase [Pyxidicoccus fallax]NMO18872.1 haloacid dehalogenase-like hydrolase [Pyxidicoccus fallax]NPC80517.1 haloacid dehalogenase-like hydrolase [Pyxidicoccus fallax]